MWRKISAIVIPTVIAVAIIAYMLVPIWSDLLEAIKTAIPIYFVAAVAICVVAWTLRGWRYRLILNGLGIRPTLGFSMACIFVSQTANLVIPARLGDLVRVFLLKHQYRTTYSQGISSILVERIYDIMTVALIGLVSIPFFLNFPNEVLRPDRGPADRRRDLLRRADRSPDGSRARTGWSGSSSRCSTRSGRSRSLLRSMVLLGGLSVVIWLVDIAVCIFVVLMFQAPLDIASVALAIVVGNLVKAVPITPGGLGTYEFTVAAILQRGGMPHVTATLVAFIDHLIKNMVTVIGGVVAVYVFGDWMFEVLRRVFNRKVMEGESLGD